MRIEGSYHLSNLCDKTANYHAKLLFQSGKELPNINSNIIIVVKHIGTLATLCYNRAIYTSINSSAL